MLIPECQKIVERESDVNGYPSTGYLKILGEFAEMIQSATAKRCAEIVRSYLREATFLALAEQAAEAIRKEFQEKPE